MTRYDRKLALAVYTMVMLAILAMVLPDGAVEYFVLAGLAAMISWPIAHGRRGGSIVPRWLISAAVLIAFAFFMFELASHVPLVRALAHFMIFVQVCKFFETKQARDYGQLIILSMLEMIVAAILSTTILFAVLLLSYLALGCYTLLLYHFRREMELFERTGRRRQTLQPAAAALAGAVETLNRTPTWRLWRFSTTAGAVALAFGAMLFICFPRNTAGWMNRHSGHAQPITGFDENPRIGQGGQVLQSDEVVMRVTVRRAGQAVALSDPLLLRGFVSYRYESDGTWRNEPEAFASQAPRLGGRRLRTRSASLIELTPGGPPVFLVSPRNNEDQLAVHVEAQPFQTSYLFAPYPPVAVSSESMMSLEFESATSVLRLRSAEAGPLAYTVHTPVNGLDHADSARAMATLPRDHLVQVRRLAEEWTAGTSDPAAAAAAILDRLKRDYSYTLNLSPAGREDPLEMFLTETKAGHCQYFASAMTVMCQQIGIPARMASGFKVIEHNDQGGYYIVRHKHAHAWCEVFLPNRGWVSFDPTPGSSNERLDSPGGLLGWFSHTVDFMNYRFQQTVLNYSQSDRESLLSKAWAWTLRLWRGAVEWIKGVWPWLAAAAMLLVVILLARKLPRRSRAGKSRTGPGHVPVGLWSEVAAVLERGRVRPPPAMTPREVCRSLANIVPTAGVEQVGELHYRVRYGRADLTAGQRNWLDETLRELAEALKRRRR